MKTFDEKTTVIGVSELRNKATLNKALEEAKKHRVLIEKSHKEVAVLLDIKRYRKMQEILNVLEDFALGCIAQERDKNSDLSDYIDIDDL